MKYTHHDIEADRQKPVGSLFLHLIDRDSIQPRPHLAASARHMYNRSLHNTPLSLYSKHDCMQPCYDSARGGAADSRDNNSNIYHNDNRGTNNCSSTPLRGRRHYTHSYHVPAHTHHASLLPPSCDAVGSVSQRSQRSASSRSRHHTAAPHEHLGADLMPRESCSSAPLRQKRRVTPSDSKAKSLGRWGSCSNHGGDEDRSCCANDEDENVASLLCYLDDHRDENNSKQVCRSNNSDKNAAPSASVVGVNRAQRVVCSSRARHHARTLYDDHLGLSTLAPRLETPVRHRATTPPPAVETDSPHETSRPGSSRQRRSCIRLFAQTQQQCSQPPLHRSGLRLVHPAPHWCSVAERQLLQMQLGTLPGMHQRESPTNKENRHHGSVASATKEMGEQSTKPSDASTSGGSHLLRTTRNANNVHNIAVHPSMKSVRSAIDGVTNRARDNSVCHGIDDESRENVVPHDDTDAGLARPSKQAMMHPRMIWSGSLSGVEDAARPSGRFRASTPAGRSYDIITGHPLPMFRAC